MKGTHATLLAVSAIAAISAQPAFTQDVTAEAVVTNYADIALAVYSDSLTTAEWLQDAIATLVAAPTEANLDAAKAAWIAARVPYQQTEVYRFGNPLVDEWEGKVNAWPLDEGLIDYVDASYGVESDFNGLYAANVIANEEIMINGSAVSIPEITPAVIADTLQEAGGVEANVASGYHAIEFLLWGQDLNGTDAGAGDRPASDYDPANCTNGNCERRAEYLTAAAELLVSDLEEMVDAWDAGGAARAAVTEDPQAGLIAMLTGMGSLSYGELAGERMKLGLLLHDPEEEHDCFSDNTHASHFNDIKGIRNVYFGTYNGTGGIISGASLADLIAASDETVSAELGMKIEQTYAAAEAMVARAEGGEAYDQMIGEGNAEGNAVVQAVIDGLVDQTASIERAVAALDLGAISVEGSDSLDDPDAVFE